MHISYYCMRQYDTLVCMYVAIRTYLVSLLVCLCTKKYSGLLSCENFFRSFDIPLVLSYVFSLPNYRLTNFLLYLFVYLYFCLKMSFLWKWKNILDSKSLNCGIASKGYFNRRNQLFYGNGTNEKINTSKIIFYGKWINKSFRQKGFYRHTSN